MTPDEIMDKATNTTPATTATENMTEAATGEVVRVENTGVAPEKLQGRLADGSDGAAAEGTSGLPTEPGVKRDLGDEFDVSQIREAADVDHDEAMRKLHEERLELLRQARYEPKDTIFIGNLFYDVTAEDLREQMIKYGVVNGVNIIYDSRGISKGYGYVQFEDKESAQRAIDAMHLRIYEGRRVTMYFAQSSMTRNLKPKTPTNTLYIGNLPFEMTDRDLQDFFKDVEGTIDVRVTVDRQTGLLRGYVHAEFINVEAAMVAREKLARRTRYGKRLVVNYSNSTKSAQGFPVAV